jgi:anti-anti-sigma regulatory factor
MIYIYILFKSGRSVISEMTAQDFIDLQSAFEHSRGTKSKSQTCIDLSEVVFMSRKEKVLGTGNVAQEGDCRY